MTTLTPHLMTKTIPIDPLRLREQVAAQIRAHDYRKGPLLLLAGPGTGKSFSLKDTIKHQIAQGRSVTDFYAMTLTNAAAGKFQAEVKTEISDCFDAVSTVHFRAKGILHKYADEVGLSKSLRILSKTELNEVLTDIQQDLALPGVSVGKRKVKKLLETYQEAAAHLQACNDEFGARFIFYRHFYRTIEWYDVIALACRILRENEDIRARESALSPFLLIDEYQDLNFAEQEFVRLLCNGRTTMLAVGDDDQSIYGGTLRYADTSGILNFRDLFPTAETLVLPVCSRCPSNILKKAHTLITKNKQRDSSKRLLLALPKVDQRSLAGLISSVNLKSAKAEIAFLAAALRHLIDIGIPPEDMLVLCATRDLGQELLRGIQLQDSKLPVEDGLRKSEGGLDQHQVLRYLTDFLKDTEDNLALRMLLTSLCQIKPSDVSVLREVAVKNCISLWSATVSGHATAWLKKPAIRGIKTFVDCVVQTGGQDLLDRLKGFAGVYPPLDHALAAWEARQATLRDSSQEEARIEEESPVTSIRFITIHSSKGLDARYVFVPFMESDLVLAGTDTEEQRRLLYVAMTRAKTAVIFTWAWSRRASARYSAGGGNVAGRQRHTFLSECGLGGDSRPEEILEKLRKLGEYEERWQRH